MKKGLKTVSFQTDLLLEVGQLGQALQKHIQEQYPGQVEEMPMVV